MFLSNIFALLLLCVASVSAQSCSPLPNPLPAPSSLPTVEALNNPWTFFNGTPLRSPSDWECRKAELKTLVQEYMYGYYPDHSQETVTASRSGNTLSITVSAAGRSATFRATLSLPTNRPPTPNAPAPVVISAGGVDNNVFLGSGIALATFNLNDVAADSNSKTGAFWTLYNGRDIGVLTAWAWGYHRILDAIVQAVPELDPTRVGATGCSRYGKAALAAGIFDDRITLSLPMSSGAEGVAPWRFHFEQSGENEKIDDITNAFPYWTTSKLRQFVGDARRLPFDAHLNVALIAPRTVIWDIGQTDYWTNPEGEAKVTFPAAKAVFDWLGLSNKVGVAIRNSWHCDISGYSNIQAFMLREFFGTPTSRDYSSISPYSSYPAAYPWLNSPPRA